MDTPISRTVTKDLVVRAAPERVFAALTEPEEMVRWYATRVEMEARPGGSVRFEWGEDWETGHLVEVERPHMLSYTWDTMGETPTLITFELAAEGEGTRLHMKHSGIGEGGDWERYYERANAGWDEELEHLRAWLEDGVEKVW